MITLLLLPVVGTECMSIFALPEAGSAEFVRNTAFIDSHLSAAILSARKVVK